MHKYFIVFRWEIQEVQHFTKILAPKQCANCSIVFAKHYIAGDPVFSDMLIWNVSSCYLEIMQEKVEHVVAGIWKTYSTFSHAVNKSS